MKHPVPSITATMEEMPERHTWAGQIMVSLDILCDLRVYFLCPACMLSSSSIHYRRRCQKGTHMKHPVPSITATMEEMPERHTWAGQIMVSLDILCVSIHISQSIIFMSCYHPVPSITATMEEMPERHT